MTKFTIKQPPRSPALRGGDQKSSVLLAAGRPSTRGFGSRGSGFGGKPIPGLRKQGMRQGMLNSWQSVGPGGNDSRL